MTNIATISHRSIRRLTMNFLVSVFVLSCSQVGRAQQSTIDSLIMASEIHHKARHYETSTALAKEALKKALKNAWMKDVARSAYVVMQNYSSMGRYDSAFKYRTIHMAARDSLFTKDKDNEIIALQVSFDLEKKEMETQVLQKENRNQRLTALMLSVILFFAVCGSYLFIRGYRREKKMRILEDAKNLQIEHQYIRLKEALRDLKQAQLQLIHTEQMASLGVLTAGIAHEINNPVNFIFGGTQALEEYVHELKRVQGKEAQATVMESLTASIKKNVAIITDMVSGLKSFTNPGIKTANKVDLWECLDSTLIILKSVFTDTIRIVKDYQEIPTVVCNPGQINQVFFHIIHNALQALEETKAAGEIRLETYAEGQNVVVIIRDNGPGISPQVRAQVFDDHFSIDYKDKDPALGLSISHNIIKDHGGTLELYTQPGKGATFIIKLPR